MRIASHPQTRVSTAVQLSAVRGLAELVSAGGLQFLKHRYTVLALKHTIDHTTVVMAAAQDLNDTS